jgi:hypothetical protein
MGINRKMCKAFGDKYRIEIIRKQNRRNLKPASWRTAVAFPARVTILFTTFTPVNSDINILSINRISEAKYRTVENEIIRNAQNIHEGYFLINLLKPSGYFRY